MVVIEMREAAYEKAFGLIDEIKDLGKKKHMILCELEDAIYDCYESSKDDDEYEHEDEDYKDEDNDTEINLRSSRGMRRNMRMRHAEDDGYEANMRGYRYKSNMRRRNRMGRFV